MSADYVEEISMNPGRPTDYVTVLQVFRAAIHIGDRAAGFFDQQ